MWIVATDGSVIFAAKHTTDEVLDVHSVVIPRDALEAALKLDKQPDLNVTATHLGAFAYKPVDGTFPNWRRVMPGRELLGIPPLNIDITLLAAASKAIATANEGKDGIYAVQVDWDGENGAVLYGRRPQCLVKVCPARRRLEYEKGRDVTYTYLETDK